MKPKALKKKSLNQKFVKETVLNGFHHIYPSQPLFERYVVEFYALLPKEVLTGGYDALHYTVTITAEPTRYAGFKHRTHKRNTI